MTKNFLTKEEQEEEEKLEVLGQESDKKAVKWVQESVKEEEKEQKRTFNNELEYLARQRKFKDEDYITALAQLLWWKLKEVDWPFGYRFKVEIAGRKLKAEFSDPFQRKYTKGIKCCGIPKFDHHAIGKMAIEAENTVDKLQNDAEFRKTKGGVYLP